MLLRDRKAIGRGLYALMLLLAFLLQSVVFGGGTFLNHQLDLVAVAAVCAAVFLGVEQGSLFGLCVGVVYCFTGADMGPVSLVALCFCCAVAGGACDRFFRQNIVPAALFAAMALILNDGVIFLLKLYFQQTRPAVFLQEVLPGMLLSLAGVVLFFPLSWWIAKAGGDRNG